MSLLLVRRALALGSALTVVLWITSVARAATYTVTNTSSSGAGTLADAVAQTNAGSGGDTIVFSGAGASGTISLSSTLTISQSVTITGPGANLLTISGSNAAQVVNVEAGTVNLSGVTIANGNNASGAGGGIEVASGATLNLTGRTVTSNTVGNGGGYGGGIANNGTLNLTDSTVSANTAISGSGDGGGIVNNGALTLTNSTVAGNSADNGGGIFNVGGPVTLVNVTISANTASTDGGGIFMNAGTLSASNSIVAGNTTTGNAGDDCALCGTSSGTNLMSSTGSVTAPMLGPLAYNGPNQTTQTLLPLPGSPAILAGSASTQSTDQRGFARPTGANVASDIGAVQTHYTGLTFVQQPTDTSVNQPISAVTVSVTESGAAAANVPVPLTLTGTGTLGGTTTATTAAPAGGGAPIASFTNLTVSAAGSGDTLQANLTVTPAGAGTPLALTATSASFNITQPAPTITFQPPASVVYGAAPILLSATINATGPTLSFVVDSGPGAIAGNVLTITGAGTIVVEAISSASNGYASGNTAANIVVAPAPLTVTVASVSRTVGEANPAFTATAAGLVNGDTLGGDIIVNATTTATATSPAGSSYPITATLSGPAAANYAATIVPGTLTVVAASGSTPDFTISASAASLSLQPGQSGTVTLTLTSIAGYTGTVQLSCSNLMPHAACTFAPATATLVTSPVTVTLTLATNMPTASLRGFSPLHARLLTRTATQPRDQVPPLPLMPAILYWLPKGAFDSRTHQKNKSKRLSRIGLLLLFCVSLALLSLAGCGGGAKGNASSTAPVTPAGQQTVTIVAQGSGGISQQVNLNVTVQ